MNISNLVDAMDIPHTSCNVTEESYGYTAEIVGPELSKKAYQSWKRHIELAYDFVTKVERTDVEYVLYLDTQSSNRVLDAISFALDGLQMKWSTS